MFSQKISTESLIILQISPNHVIFYTILHKNWCFFKIFPKLLLAKISVVPGKSYTFFVKYSPVEDHQAQLM